MSQVPYDQVMTCARDHGLMAWLDKSVTVKRGRPLVVYHGTKAVFDTFDAAYLSTGRCDNEEEDICGFFFTTSLRMASRYAHGGRLLAAVLRVSHPYEVTARQWGLAEGLSPRKAKAAGHDSFVIHGQEGGDTWMVFSDQDVRIIDVTTRPREWIRPKQLTQAMG